MKKLIIAIALMAVISTTAKGQSEPPYGMSHLQAYSIFYENYRSGNYDMALQFGRWMMEAKPKELKGMNRFSLETQFNRMRKVYTEIAKQQEDSQMKAAYLDTAEAIFDEVFDTFNEDEIDYLEWHHKKGTFYQENSEHIENGMEKAFQQYEKVFEMDPERFTTLSDGYYAQILLSYYVSNNEKQQALEAIDKIEPHADDKLMSVINDARDELFDSPEERIDFLVSQLEKDPNNTELINELADLYERVGNREKAIETSEKLYNLNPNFENTRNLAEIALNDAKYDLALKYLKEALDKAPDNNAKKRIALEIAEAYQNTDNLQSARRYARQASQIDPTWGEPFMRIASIYAAAVSNCTRGRTIERDDRTVYWLVLDYLDKARSVDSSVASRVNQQYQSYQNVMPQAEDKFFKGWETGDTFRIDESVGECYSWINETTKVR